MDKADPATIDLIRGSITDSRKLHLDYYAFGRDERAGRVVQPHRVQVSEPAGDHHDELVRPLDEVRDPGVVDASPFFEPSPMGFGKEPDRVRRRLPEHLLDILDPAVLVRDPVRPGRARPRVLGQQRQRVWPALMSR